MVRAKKEGNNEATSCFNFGRPLDRQPAAWRGNPAVPCRMRREYGEYGFDRLDSRVVSAVAIYRQQYAG